MVIHQLFFTIPNSLPITTYSSTLFSTQPSFLSYATGNSKTTPGFWGFNASGMYITGDASTTSNSYPLRTNINIPGTRGFTLQFSMFRNNSCSDHGFCIFKTGTSPTWNWGPQSSRIAIQWDCTNPYLYGASSTNSLITSSAGGTANWYSIQVDYAITPSIRVRLWNGQNIFSGATIVDTTYTNADLGLSSISVSSGDTYNLGFDADQDNTTISSLFSHMTIIA
jgi:hypothetical protein